MWQPNGVNKQYNTIKVSIKKFVLSIESSCDETSVSFLEVDNFDPDNSLVTSFKSTRVVSSVISSQIKIHAQFGGVIPEVGARLHAEKIHSILQTALEQCNSNIDLVYQLDYIFVTTEPGLVSALRVGVEFAKSLQFFIQKSTLRQVPIVSVNHLRGHIASCFYESSQTLSSDISLFPHLHLLVSGGNTQLILLKSWKEWEIIGQTLDDAAGETLDKIARMVGIQYPGGAQIAKIAEEVELNYFDLPVSMNNKQLNYSFSGLKTAVRYLIQKQNIPELIFEKPLTTEELDDIINGVNTSKSDFIKQVCISAQYLVIDQLMRKIDLAVRTFAPQTIGISGGVSANKLLRKRITKLGAKYNIPNIFIPPLSLTGDNAIMIGLAGIADLLN
jgi:N6-L-threonylcarbamoyladenine synthase